MKPKKIKISTLAKELKMDIHQLVKLKMDKLTNAQYTGFGSSSSLTPEGADILRLAAESPNALPSKLLGTVLHEAKNPRWVFAVIDGMPGKHPVLVHHRDRGRINKKRIAINAITDERGTTYTYNPSRS